MHSVLQSPLKWGGGDRKICKRVFEEYWVNPLALSEILEIPIVLSCKSNKCKQLVILNHEAFERNSPHTETHLYMSLDSDVLRRCMYGDV